MIGKTDEVGYRVDFNELPDAHLEHAAEYFRTTRSAHRRERNADDAIESTS